MWLRVIHYLSCRVKKNEGLAQTVRQLGLWAEGPVSHTQKPDMNQRC